MLNGEVQDLTVAEVRELAAASGVRAGEWLKAHSSARLSSSDGSNPSTLPSELR